MLGIQQFLDVFDVQWPWPIYLSTENWHSSYLCLGTLCQFWFFDFSTFLFSRYKPIQDRQMDKMHSVAYSPAA